MSTSAKFWTLALALGLGLGVVGTSRAESPPSRSPYVSTSGTGATELARECDAIVRRLEERYGKPKVWRVFPVRLKPGQGGSVAGYTRYAKPNVVEVVVYQTLEEARGGTLEHELTHAFFFYYFDNNFDLLLNEGMAQNSEYARRDVLRANVYRRYLAGDFLPLDRLYGLGRYDSGLLIYCEGFSVVDFLIGRGGSRWFVEFVDELTNGVDGGAIDAALERYYGYPSLQALERDWLDYVEQGQDRKKTDSVK